MINTCFHKVVLLFILCLCVFETFSQDGDYYVSNHSVSLDGSTLDNMNFDVDITSHGILSIANRQGVIFYDGKSWEYFKTSGAAISISNGQDGITYVGCVSDFGKIDLVNKDMRFVSLQDSLTSGETYFQTKCVNQKVYFLSDRLLQIYETTTENVSSLVPPNPDERFEYLFSIDDDSSVYIASDLRLYQLRGNILSDAENFKIPSGSGIQSVVKRPLNFQYLLATVDNELYEIKSGEFRLLNKIDLSVDSITSIDIVQVEWINDRTFALSTVSNGVLIYDYESLKRKGHLDYNKGLPDNEIYDIHRDQNEGLWITHEYGLTRVCPEIPVKSYNSYPGLEGNLLTIKNYKDSIYVGTSQGLFVFVEDRRYENIVSYQKVKEEKPKTHEKKAPVYNKKRKTLNSDLSKTDEDSQDKKFQLFKKKENGKKTREKKPKKKRRSKRDALRKEKKEDPSVITKVFKKITTTLANVGDQIKRKEDIDEKETYVYKKRVYKRLVDSQFVYKKIEGLHTKAKQIIEFKGQLVVAGNGGLHEISGYDANLIVDEPIRYAKVINSKNKLIVSTISNDLFLYDYLDSIWVLTDTLMSPRNTVISMLENGQESILMAGATSLYDLSLSDFVTFRDEIEIPNQYFDHIRLTRLDSTIYLINGQGYFMYNDQEHTVHEDTNLLDQLGKPLRHLQQSNGLVWVYNGKKWGRIERDGSITTYDYFSLFPDMSYIDYNDGAFWIINNQEELIKFNPSSAESLSFSSRMFFKGIYTKEGYINRKRELIFSYDNNSIRFELSRPDYLGFLNVEYQYKMEGLDQEWSDWSSENEFSFNYLRPNRYKMLVRSKDAFGNIQECEPFQFKIKPPYWQEPWFNMLQVVLFASLIIFSSRLNRKGEPQYLWLTRILTVLTLVLVIEFLQTVAQTYLNIQSTPVVEFLINVVVALFVFPIELLLKKVIRVNY